MMRKIPIIITALYLVLVLLSIIPVFIGDDSLDAIFLVLFTLPWSFLITPVVDAVNPSMLGNRVHTLLTLIEDLTLIQVSFDDLGLQTVAPEQWIDNLGMASLLASNYDPDQSKNIVLHLPADPNDSAVAVRIQLIKFSQMEVDTAIEILVPETLKITRQGVTVGNNKWTVLEGGDSSSSGRVGLFNTNGDVFVIVINAQSINADAVFDKLWQPLLENFKLTQ